MKTICGKYKCTYNKCNKSFRRHASTNLKQQLKFLTTLTFGPQLDKYLPDHTMPCLPHLANAQRRKTQPTFGHNKFCQHGKFTLVSELTKCVEFCWPLKTRNEKLERNFSIHVQTYHSRCVCLARAPALWLRASFVVLYIMVSGKWEAARQQLGSSSAAASQAASHSTSPQKFANNATLTHLLNV